MGRHALVTEQENGWVCGTGCLRIRPGQRLDPEFLSHTFDRPAIRAWLSTNAVGTTMANLSAEILARLPVAVPSLPDQQGIASFLNSVDRKLVAEERHKSALEVLFKSLLEHLMTGKVRVTSELVAPNEGGM